MANGAPPSGPGEDAADAPTGAAGTADGATADQAEARRALFHVVRGGPDVVELAALTAVLSAAAGGAPAAGPSAPPSAWTDPRARLRTELTVGPHAWRTSTLPR